MKNKRSLELVTSHSTGYKTSSEKILYWLYYLTKFDDVIKAAFELFQKLNLQIYASQFMTS